MSDTATKEQILQEALDEIGQEKTVEPTPDALPAIREYIVFVEQAADVWRRLETVNAGSPDAAVKSVSGGVDQNKRYAVVAGRYWQVGKPKVKQITQTSIEFE